MADLHGTCKARFEPVRRALARNLDSGEELGASLVSSARRHARTRGCTTGAPVAYGGAVQEVPWWGLASAAAAPVLLVGGWTAAAAVQPHFDQVADTVSLLAAPGATDRWVMTLTFLVVGVCYIVTGLALRPAATAGRMILVAGSAAGMMVAANPVHAGTAYPAAHMIWASIGLAGLTTWPAGAWRRGPSVPWGLRPAVAAAAVAALFALLVWFLAELVTGAGQVGLAERVTGIAQAAWPLAVVLCCRPARYRERPVPAVAVNRTTAV